LALGAYAYGRVRRREDANRLFKRLEETAAAAWVIGYLAIEDDKQALYWLNLAAEKREPYEAYFALIGLKTNWFSDPILDQPEFVAVRSRLGLGSNPADVRFLQADIQNVHVWVMLYGCLWPKADIETKSKWVFLNVCFGEKSSR